MNKMRLSFVFVLIAGLSVGSIAAQSAWTSVTGDVYKAGATVLLENDVEGDLVVAGGKIMMDYSVSEDFTAAGGVVTISGKVDDDIRAAGGWVTVAGVVGEDLMAAGYSVTLKASSEVGGHARLYGNTVAVAGNVNQSLSVKGGTVILSGTFGGDVEVNADSFHLESDAVISGNLTYAVYGDVEISDSATIEGEVSGQELDLTDPESWATAVLGSLKFYLSVALCAIVLFLIYPRWFVSMADRVAEAPFKSLGLGFVVLVVAPVAAIALLFTVYGIPLGLIALMVFLATLVAGLLAGVTWIGGAVFRLLGKMPDQTKWMRAASIMAGAVVLMLIDFIPFIGGWIFFAVLLMGIGGMKRYFYGIYNQQGG